MVVSGYRRSSTYSSKWLASCGALWLCLAALANCGDKGEIREITSTGGTGGGQGTASDGAAGVSSFDSAAARRDAGVDGPPSLDAARDAEEPVICPPTEPPPASIRRLSREQYGNTVRDLLGDTTIAVTDMLENDFTYEGDGETFSPSAGTVNAYHTLAHQLASQVTGAGTLATLLQCDPAQVGEESCRHTFIANFLAGSFRRPATTDDIADFEGAFATGQQIEGTFAAGARAVVEVALQSPEFLYRVEFGDPALDRGAGWARPAPYEMATRLSYLLGNSMPDAELRDAAAQGKLGTPLEIETQARRLLASPRAHEVVRNFYFRRLGFIKGTAWVPPNSLTFTQTIADLAQQETERYLDDVVWSGPGDFASVLTSPTTWLNGKLAAFYGVGAVTGDTFRKVNVEPARRAGILTQASFLSATSTFSSTNPIQRGYRVASEFLCLDIPPEPLEISAIQLPLGNGKTNRERVAMSTASSQCASCHQHLEPLGFAFENYDTVGLWRDTESGVTVDARGTIYETDAQGTFTGAVELARRLAQSRDAQNCFSDKWAKFAYPDRLLSEPSCTRNALRTAFAEGKLSVRELLVALTQTDDFMFRPLQTP